MGTNDLTFNKDGSVDLPIEGKPIRFVKESDLLVVKGAKENLEKEIDSSKTQFNTALAEANRVQAESHQQVLQMQAANEQLKSNQSDHDALKTKAGELEKELGSHKESISKHEKELTDRIRTNLITVFGAKEDALKDKTLDQLRNIEEAAKVIGNGHLPSKPANYDGGHGGASGGSVPEAPLDRAKRILEEHEKSGHRIGAMGTVKLKV